MSLRDTELSHDEHVRTHLWVGQPTWTFTMGQRGRRVGYSGESLWDVFSDGVLRVVIRRRGVSGTSTACDDGAEMGIGSGCKAKRRPDLGGGLFSTYLQGKSEAGEDGCSRLDLAVDRMRRTWPRRASSENQLLLALVPSSF